MLLLCMMIFVGVVSCNEFATTTPEPAAVVGGGEVRLNAYAEWNEFVHAINNPSVATLAPPAYSFMFQEGFLGH